MPKCKHCENEAEWEAKLQLLTLAAPYKPGIHFEQSVRKETKVDICAQCYEKFEWLLSPMK